MGEETELEWGALLMILRLLRGWSQEELATEARVSVSAITRQERGLAPKPAIREKLEKALGVEGKGLELQRTLGALRAAMMSPSTNNRAIQEAISQASWLTEVSLQRGLAELRDMEDPLGSPGETERLPMGLDDLRREREEREERNRRN